ncbi:EAL domain-containing protein [Hydrogenovibrio sp. SC-1]|uniref:EAL domain-containing protein n=1 Tax=Hydrogenovibrio sp. SC-1 TaxID=2065820 RepID=UPI0013044760|nr:EAL domain-containing protein [Hydrogenovibrio sp. SC-1]
MAVINRIFTFALNALVTLGVLCGGIAQADHAKSTINLAVFAHSNAEATIKRYQPLADYLSQQLPHHTVKLYAMDDSALRTAVQHNQIDLVLANPSLYQIIRHENALNNAIATVQTAYKGKHLNTFGGVIFSLSGREDIQSLNDLANKTIAIPSFRSSGAFSIPMAELAKHTGLTQQDLNFITTHDNERVIEAVLSKKADVGFVRSGILEQSINDGNLSGLDIKVIHARDLFNYPFKLSTTLYPEWPFAVLSHIDETTTKQIALALYNLTADHPAAKAAQIAGFIPPSDYLPYEKILRELQLEPYHIPPQFSLKQFWQQYTFDIILVGILIIILAISLLRALYLHQRLLSSMQLVQLHEKVLSDKAALDEILLALPSQITKLSESDFIHQALDEIEGHIGSEVGFVHLYNNQNQTFELITHSSQTTRKQFHEIIVSSYAIEEAGIEAQILQTQKPLILNDISAGTESIGQLNDLSPLTRLLIVPVTYQDRVEMLFALANKSSDYTHEDVNALQLLANEIWRLIEQKRTHRQIIKQQHQYERLVDEIGENYCLYSLNAQGIITYISDSAAVIFETQTEQILNQYWHQVIQCLPEDQAIVDDSIQNLLNKHQAKNEFSFRFDARSGQRKTLKLIQHATLDKDGKLISIDGLIENITEQTETENELRQAASVFTHAQEAILITDPSGVILNVNQAFEKITGYKKAEALGNTPKLLNSGKQDKDFYEEMWRQLIEDGKWSGEIWNKRKDGRIYPEKLTISAIYNKDDTIKNYIALFSDITVEKEQRSQLELIAHYDMLTGLPNRMLFADRLNQAIASAKRHATSIAVLFIDLDGFKAVNDQHGHQAGDYLLRTIAKRFKSAIREEDSISRYGGDEFVAVILNADHLKTLTPLLKRFLDHANEPILYQDMTFSVSASIGVTFFHHHQDLDAEQVIRQADQAMYQAKMRGKNQTYVFDIHGADQITSSEVIALKDAIKNNELVLYYQPKVNLKTGKLYGLEALIRWQHPDKGLLQPSDFVHLIQSPELAFEAGFWVIEAAFKQMRAWQVEGKLLPVSVNIDGVLLLDHRFSNHLPTLLEKYHQIPPSFLTFEILETSAIEDIVSTTNVMKRCTAMGIQFSIDDFGTGYASLTYLKTLPVHELKADLSFVKDLQTDPQSLSIMESIIGMGNAFNLNVVAEGVETEYVANLLLKLGYELIQGYEISRPMPADHVLEWLQHWHTKPQWQSMTHATEDELVFITAAIEHRAWINQIEFFLTDRADWPPEMDGTRCRFAHWLEQKEAKDRLPELQYQHVQTIHAQIHELGQKLITEKLNGNHHNAKNGLEKLHELKTELLKNIDYSRLTHD